MAQQNAQGWYTSVMDPGILVNDSFTYMRANDGNTYRIRVKGNPDTGNIDYYWKGGGNGFNGAGIGGDVLMFQASPSKGQRGTNIIAGKNGFEYKNFFDGAQEDYNHKILTSSKKGLYEQATQTQRDNLDTLNSYRGFKNTAPPAPAKPGGTPAANPNGAQQPADPNNPQTPPPPKISKEDLEKSIKPIERTEYEPLLRYPITLNQKYQDYIKFQMVTYKPRGIGASAENLGVIPGRERIDTSINQSVSGARKILGSVILPIPGNISDTNTVGWGDAKVDPLTTALTEAAVSGIREGFEGLANTATKAQNTASKNTVAIKQAIVGKFTELATGINPLTRLYGIVANPNLELLFNGPDLRNFSFTFRLSPRDATEAKEILKIIRFFKQGMSVKRTEGELFLKSPHVFQLSYWNTERREHPYLNKFKECALKSFSVNYAPDGTYMTFNHRDEPSMTAYEITMQFTELEPIFDDDYDSVD